jgi:KUP system potassium uptake protein
MLIFWSLILVISIKYAILIVRADNHGEGDPRTAHDYTRRASERLAYNPGSPGARELRCSMVTAPSRRPSWSAIEGVKVYARSSAKLSPLTAILVLLSVHDQRRGLNPPDVRQDRAPPSTRVH